MPGMGNASAGAPGGAMPTGAAPATAAAPAPAAIEYEKVPFAKAPKNSGVKRVVKASELGPDIVMYQFTWKESTGGVVWYVELPEHYTKTDRTAAAWQQLYRALGESSEARKLKQELDFYERFFRKQETGPPVEVRFFYCCFIFVCLCNLPLVWPALQPCYASDRYAPGPGGAEAGALETRLRIWRGSPL